MLKEGSLLAYLVSITLRITEIHRALKPSGVFFLHCDPTASHYLKLVLDAVFCSQQGEFLNEIVWCYSIGGKSKYKFGEKHDVILFYSKDNKRNHTFNEGGASIARKPNSHMRVGVDADGRQYQAKTDRKSGKTYRYYLDEGKIAEDYWTDIETLNREDRERLGYPTQKPEALLERIIKTCSNAGDVVLDAYCGCGTTVAVAQRLNRRWTGIDITYQSISVILKRFERDFSKATADAVLLDGAPRDMESAKALAHKKDDRSRKEFEKWAILTYTVNRGIINEKKGGDRGIDGVAYILVGEAKAEKMLLQVKSGATGRGDIAKLRGDMDREAARMGCLITLEEPTKGMLAEAKAAGMFTHPLTGSTVDKITIVTIKQVVEGKLRLELPVSLDALWKAKESGKGAQLSLFVPVKEKSQRKPVQSETGPVSAARLRSN